MGRLGGSFILFRFGLLTISLGVCSFESSFDFSFELSLKETDFVSSNTLVLKDDWKVLFFCTVILFCQSVTESGLDSCESLEF